MMLMKWIMKFWWIALFIAPIVVGVIICLPITNIDNGSNDGWLGFWGGYLGAIITIFGVYTQIQSEIKRDADNRKKSDDDRERERRLQRLDQYIAVRPRLLLTFQENLQQNNLSWNELYFNSKGDQTSGFVLENNGSKNVYNIYFYGAHASNIEGPIVLYIPIIKSNSSVAVKMASFDSTPTNFTELGYQFETEMHEIGFVLIDNTNYRRNQIFKPRISGFEKDYVNQYEKILMNDKVNVESTSEIDDNRYILFKKALEYPSTTYVTPRE